MKKRLLSAALALAMVLTMLPLTVFAEDPTTQTGSGTTTTPTATLPSATQGISAADGTNCNGQTFTYRTKDYVLIKGDTDKSIDEVKAPMAGWYWVKPAKENDPAVAYSAEDGVFTGTSSTSNTWYESAEAALEAKASTLKLLANAGSCDLTKATGTSLTIHLNGFTLALSTGTDGALENTATDAAKKTTLTSLTIKNTEKTDDDKWPAVSGSITAKNQNFSYTAENTAGDSAPAITLENTTTSAKTLTVSLTDAKVGAITTKLAKLALTVTSKTAVGAAETGEIKVNEDIAVDAIDPAASSITVTSGTLDAITWNGDGTITVNGSSEVGDITIDGGTKDATSKALPKWGGNTTVTVNGGTVSKVAEVNAGTDGVITVNVNKGATVEEIDLSKSNTAHVVKVDGGTATDGNSNNPKGITMNAGKLDIQNGAVVGPVTLGAASKGSTITVNVSGASTVVNGLAVTSGSTVAPTVNITGGTFTGAVNLGTSYNKKTISGGTFSSSIAGETGWLKGVTYEIGTEKSNNAFTKFTYTDSFQACVDATKNAATAADVQITAVGATGNTYYTATFKMGMGTDAQTVVAIRTDNQVPIYLPSAVNGNTVDVWYVGTERKTPGAPVLLNANIDITTAVGAAASGEIVEVKAGTGCELSVSLSGTTIKVTGALPANSGLSTEIPLVIKTADDQEHSVSVYFQQNADGRTGKLITTTLSDPFYANEANTGIKVKGLDSVTYLLDGSGIVIAAGSADVGALGDSEATSNVSGLDAAKKAELENTLAESEATGLLDDPAVTEAANKILAGITETQATTYIRNAKIAMWKKDNNSTKTPDDTELGKAPYVNYTKVEVVVYLHITAKTWDQSAGSQSMQLDIEPWYRLEVTGDSVATGKEYVYQTGRALPMSGVTSDYDDDGIEITLNLPTGFAPAWAHHKDYVYKIEDSKFTTMHGFSPFLLNGVSPKAELHKKGTGDTLVGYYDNVQTAIDDVEDGGKVTLLANYGKTSETFSVTGKARTFTFDVGPNGTFTPSFSGANVTTNPAVGSERTVQLSADNVTTAKITVNTATNGTAALTTPSTANRGSTVTGTLSPSKGYKVGTVTAKSNTGANVSVSVDTTKNTFSFVVPSDATSVTVTPTFVVDDGMDFVDVAKGDWFYDGVYYCFTHNAGGQPIMEGTDATHFYPGSTLVRGDFVKVLWRLAGAPVETPTVTYSDVPSSYHAYNAIVWATNHGIAKGYGDGTFKPTVGVSRQEMVTFLWRAAESPKVSVDLASRFTDGGGVASWAREAMQWAAGLNILCGVSSVNVGSTLYPWEQAKRAQIAVTAATYHDMYSSGSHDNHKKARPEKSGRAFFAGKRSAPGPVGGVRGAGGLILGFLRGLPAVLRAVRRIIRRGRHGDGLVNDVDVPGGGLDVGQLLGAGGGVSALHQGGVAALQDGHHFAAGDGFLLQQVGHHLVHVLPVGLNDLHRGLVAHVEDGFDGLVHHRGGVLGAVQAVAAVQVLVADGAQGHHAEFLAHAVHGHHVPGDAGGLLDVLGGAVGHGLHHHFLGGAAAHGYGDFGHQLFPGAQVGLVLLGHQQGVTQAALGVGDDGDFLHRLGVFLLVGHHGVAHLVVGHQLALELGEDGVFLFAAGDDELEGGQQVLLGD